MICSSLNRLPFIVRLLSVTDSTPSWRNFRGSRHDLWPRFSVRLATLDLLACVAPLAFAGAAELGDGHGLVKLGHSAEHLADQLGCRAVIQEGIRTVGGHEVDPELPKFGEADLLHHQVAGEAVCRLHDDGADAVAGNCL